MLAFSAVYLGHKKRLITLTLASKIEASSGKQGNEYIYIYMGVSENSGTPKWMVYNGKPY